MRIVFLYIFVNICCSFFLFVKCDNHFWNRAIRRVVYYYHTIRQVSNFIFKGHPILRPKANVLKGTIRYMVKKTMKLIKILKTKPHKDKAMASVQFEHCNQHAQRNGRSSIIVTCLPELK